MLAAITFASFVCPDQSRPVGGWPLPDSCPWSFVAEHGRRRSADGYEWRVGPVPIQVSWLAEDDRNTLCSRLV